MTSVFGRGDGGEGGKWEMDSRKAFKKHNQQVLQQYERRDGLTGPSWFGIRSS